MDPLEYDIKLTLISSPAMRLQWKEILGALYPKYKEEFKTKNSFSVALHRKLRKIADSSDLEKEAKGHQQVFYFIPEKRQRKVLEGIEKECVLRRFDTFWDSFSSDQKKRIVQDSVAERQFFFSFVRNVSLEFLSMMKELVEPWISGLENPTEEIRAKYSQEERKHFLSEFHDLQKESEKIETDMTRDNQQISKEEFKELMKLTQEFYEKIVPKYPGGWREAVTDLMRKAVEEESRRDKQ